MQDIETLAKLQTDQDLALFRRLKNREADLRAALQALGTSTAQSINDIRHAEQNLLWRNWATQKAQELNIHLAQCLAAQDTQRGQAVQSWARQQAIQDQKTACAASKKATLSKKTQDHAIATIVINPVARYR